MSDHIEVSVADTVSMVRFNRPEKKNAITIAMYEALAAALERGERDQAVRVHTLFGSEGIFTAGNDLKDFLAVAEGGEHSERAIDLLRVLATTKKPVVAAVDGPAIGIGTTMLLHCDLVYATPRARFATPFLDLGLVPEAASSLIAPRLMGPQRAFELLCLGAEFTPQRAMAAGFVNAVVEPQAVEAVALEAARELAGKPPEALAVARKLLRGNGADILVRIEEERAHFAARLRSQEARAAIEAFLNR